MKELAVYLFLLVSNAESDGEPFMLQGFNPLQMPDVATCIERRDTFREDPIYDKLEEAFDKVFVGCIEVDRTVPGSNYQDQMTDMFHDYEPVVYKETF